MNKSSHNACPALSMASALAYKSVVLLRRFHNDDLENFPFFMFGDFNFRLDTKSVVEVCLHLNC